MSVENEKLSVSTESFSKTERVKQYKRMVTRRSQKCQVEYFKSGVALKVSFPIVQKTGGGLRGNIREWSSASRRRLRIFMLQNIAPAGWDTLGVSFTVPGKPLTVKQTKKLWDNFRLSLKREQVGMVWRLEVQQRGAVHWHCITIVPHELQQTPSLTLGGWTEWIVTKKWFEALDSLGEYTHDKIQNFGFGQSGYFVGLRSYMQGALQHAVDVQEDGGRGAWLRYIQDHASKSKQEQMPVGFGRHWGVIGKRFFQQQKGNTVEVDTKSYYRFLRMYRRLCTPSYQCPGKPFNRSLGFRPGRGARGVSVWFSKPETVRKLQDWASNEKNYADV
jgi:hypothetical protein